MHCSIRSFKVTVTISSILILALIAGLATSTEAAEPVVKIEKSWNDDGDKIAGNAKNEGEVVIYHGSGGARPTMASEFTKKYGIEVNTLTGRPTELLARMFGEERTGRPTVDIIATGNQLSIELKARNVIF